MKLTKENWKSDIQENTATIEGSNYYKHILEDRSKRREKIKNPFEIVELREAKKKQMELDALETKQENTCELVKENVKEEFTEQKVQEILTKLNVEIPQEVCTPSLDKQEMTQEVDIKIVENEIQQIKEEETVNKFQESEDIVEENIIIEDIIEEFNIKPEHSKEIYKTGYEFICALLENEINYIDAKDVENLLGIQNYIEQEKSYSLDKCNLFYEYIKQKPNLEKPQVEWLYSKQKEVRQEFVNNGLRNKLNTIQKTLVSMRLQG